MESLLEKVNNHRHSRWLLTNSLHQLENIAPTFQALGSRHQGYGVKEADYETFWAALISMLKTGLRNEVTPEIGKAWESVYNLMTSYMSMAKK